jgi:hypothetical protein
MNYVKAHLDLAFKKQREWNPKGCVAEVQPLANSALATRTPLPLHDAFKSYIHILRADVLNCCVSNALVCS